jgi:hypothetical protein
MGWWEVVGLVRMVMVYGSVKEGYNGHVNFIVKVVEKMVTEAYYSFALSAEELDLLKAIANEDPVISLPFFAGNSGQIHLTRPETRLLGDRLTNRLAQVGFDGKYELTEEGKQIENLIDKLLIL